MFSIGVPKNSILKYEASLKTGKYMVVFHGTPDEVTRVKETLTGLDAAETDVHMSDAAMAVV
jgi:hypothetical protein